MNFNISIFSFSVFQFHFFVFSRKTFINYEAFLGIHTTTEFIILGNFLFISNSN
ncbi:hypothetical protein MmiEs2_09850 [Methanimicrococcus stummii]|uniref:Uncharacterized protein n=1 Tax=Methanimicrococcus stummii TaxID=3028294 RepID=A0AA96VA91_9EURY|nr:hypothetical protein MmiEs2_09850 [Methanimicrococcus sp. Es2]